MVNIMVKQNSAKTSAFCEILLKSDESQKNNRLFFCDLNHGLTILLKSDESQKMNVHSKIEQLFKISNV